MPEQFLHGVEVIEIDKGPRPIRTVRSSVIGIIGTAPLADETKFPINTPVLIAGSRTEAAFLGTTGTLPNAIDNILDQAGALIIVVRVEEGEDAAETKANILGGVDGTTGQYEGVHAFLGAESSLGYRPRILLAPGFTGNRTTGGVTSIAVGGSGGSGYTSAPTVGITAPPTGGTQATAVAVLGTGANAAKVVAINVTHPGAGYLSAPTVTLTGGGGSSATGTASIGTVRDSVIAELLGIADRLRGWILADGPNTNDAAAIQYRNDFGSKRVNVIDPQVIVDRSGALVQEPASSVFAGIIARVDNELGFWWSPSNKEVNGISGTARSVDFTLGDPNSRANLLNENEVTTIIRQEGYRLWGNRTCSSDPKWAFLSVVRTADIINDSLQQAHLWAVDRNITKTYVEDVTEGVNNYLRHLKTIGAIIDGFCWADPAVNTPDQIAQGIVTFDFDFTPPYPAEHVIFRSMLTNDYLTEIFE